MRRASGLLLATVFALALGLSPVGAGTALAAGTLQIGADATYTLDPAAGRVHVAIDIEATNLKQNTPSVIYYYRSTGFGLQREAASIRATDRQGPIAITTRKHEQFIEAVVQFRANLYYRDSTRFTIRYDLVGGAPRSASSIRVGRAFATFGVWAWGDTGRSTVEVHTPAGFVSRLDGDDMRVTTNPNTSQVLRAAPADPATFYSIVSAENEAAYRTTRISFGGGVEIVVKAWPEDSAWNAAAGETLREGVPLLRQLIGLDWPVERDLDVRERYTPALEGYAGVFFNEEQRIDVSEDLDPLVIVHETSHAWFNPDLFTERWIYEGLAEEYAWRVVTTTGGDAGGAPEQPDLKDPGYLALTGWTHPQVIRDQETDDRERYGYQAAFWVVHQIVAAAGVDRMRGAFADADANLTAYPGAGPRETVAPADSWMRLLDLAQPVAGADSPVVEAAMRVYVLAAGDHLLDDRRAARSAYRTLVENGEGWLAPWYVRGPLGEWQFVQATARMSEASAVLVSRDRIETAAAQLELEPGDALETAYEVAADNLDAAKAIATEELGALSALAEAASNVEAPPDLVTQVGLLGETPRAPYEAARSAFERGDLDGAVSSAAAATAIMVGAHAAGEQRLVLAAVLALALLLLVVAVVLVRRRRHATLAADPAAAPPPPSASPQPDDEGGPARGDSPADP